MRRACCSSPAGVPSAPLRRGRDQLVVRTAAPEEERQPRRQVEVVDLVGLPGARAGRRFLQPEDEVRAREDRLQRRADADLEPAGLALVLVELHQPVDVGGGHRPAVGLGRERGDDRASRTPAPRPVESGRQVKTRRRLGVSDTPVTRCGPTTANSRRCGSVVTRDGAADLRVGQRLLDRREQIVDRRLGAQDEGGGDALRTRLDRDRRRLGIALGVLIAQGAKAGINMRSTWTSGPASPSTSSTLLISLTRGHAGHRRRSRAARSPAARTAPVAAMRGDVAVAPKGLRLRGTIGAALVALAAGVLAVSVTRSSVPWSIAGLGAGMAALGMLVAAPWVARPVVRVIAWPFVMLVGVIGRLARQNALRVPRRTAATASALMIGLALVSGISVLAQSVKASVSEGVANELVSDFVLNAAEFPVPAAVAVEARGLPDVESASAISHVPVRIEDFSAVAIAASAPDVSANFTVDMASGTLEALAGDTVLIDRTTADLQGWTVGDDLNATIGTLAKHRLVVGGIYEDSQAFAHMMVDRSLYLSAVPAALQSDARVFVRATPGADLAELRAELTTVTSPYLQVSVQDRSEFAAEQGASIDTVLNLLYVLLLFSVVIAILGIVNTLALSVLERTREIGLLRAVGLLRRQLGGVITIEAIATAVFGAILGTVLGLGLGIALEHGLQAQGLNTLGIPWLLILAMLLASILVGVLAAVAPSIRAARLNILQAIAAA